MQQAVTLPGSGCGGRRDGRLLGPDRRYADTLREKHYDEIIISTFPPRLALAQDGLAGTRRKTVRPTITHIVATNEMDSLEPRNPR